MNKMQNDVKKQLRLAKFAYHETALFLDTHPGDEAALAYLEKTRDDMERAGHMYEKEYGPLAVSDASACDGRWAWIDGPWPWEREA